MSEDILLRIIAQDQYSQEMKEARTAVDNMTDAEKKSALAAKEHGAQLQKLGSIAKGAAVAGIGAITAAIGESLNETMEYNKSIRDLAQNLAITTEETSRIVQTADDFTVSQENVTAALQMAVKKGMAPSIDTLAKMADEYNNISDPTERAARLTEVFGRNWTALTPMLKEGGQAIRDAAAAQDDALIVTEAQSKATRDLEKNLDNLGDKVTALKLKVGNALVPVLNQAADAFTALTQGVGSADEKENEYARTIAQLTFGLGAENDQVKRATEEFRNYLKIKQEVGMLDTEKRIRAETGAIRELTVGVGLSTAGMAQYADAVRIAHAADSDYKLATDALILNTQALTKETLLRIATEGLSADAALKMAASMGFVDERTASAIEKQRALKKQYDDGYISLDQYIEKTRELGTEINLLPDLHVITVEVNYQTGGHAGRVGGEVDYNAPTPTGKPTTSKPSTKPSNKGGHEAGGATGLSMVVPPGYPNDSYRVGVTSGERVEVTPRGQDAGGVIINNYIAPTPGMDTEALAAKVSQITARKLRSARASGAGRQA